MRKKKNKKVEEIIEQPIIEEPIMEEIPEEEPIKEEIKEEVKEDLPKHFMALTSNFDHAIVCGEKVNYKGHLCRVTRVKPGKIFLCRED